MVGNGTHLIVESQNNNINIRVVFRAIQIGKVEE